MKNSGMKDLKNYEVQYYFEEGDFLQAEYFKPCESEKIPKEIKEYMEGRPGLIWECCGKHFCCSSYAYEGGENDTIFFVRKPSKK